MNLKYKYGIYYRVGNVFLELNDWINYYQFQTYPSLT